MQLDHLRLFVDVVHAGSFAAVARERGLDPSSISRAVQGLERDLGVALLFRTTRSLSLTEAGRAYFQRVEPLVAELDAAAEQVGSQGSSVEGELRVLSPVSFALTNLVPLLPTFLQAHPGLRLDLQLGDALLDLAENRLDVAIRLGPLADSSYVCRKLSPMVPRVCASPAYLERFGRPTHPEELGEHACLLLDLRGFGNRWLFRDRRGRQSYVDVRGQLKTSNALALKQLALAGQGIVLQGEWVVGEELANGRLVDLFPDHEVTASYFDNAAWTLRHPAARVPRKVEVFLEFLHDAFERGAPGAQARSASESGSTDLPIPAPVT